MSGGELAEKRRRLDALLDAAGLETLVLTRGGNVSWLACGARAHVLPETPVVALVVRRDGIEAVTAVNEAERLEREELTGLDIGVRALPWNEDLLAALPRGDGVGSDAPAAGRRDVSAAVEAARRALTPPEVERLRLLASDAADAMTEACTSLDARLSESAAAGRLASACLERGLDPYLILVAGDARRRWARHPLPTAVELGRLAMLVLCGRRHGLIVSLTRMVALDALLPSDEDTYARLVRVDAAYNAATVPGRRVGEVFRRGSAAYAEQGLDPDASRWHHQGGPTGYQGRDSLADADSAALVEDQQAFAWNPSVDGLKCEDTVLAGGELCEVLTLDPTWPARDVAGLRRPLILPP